MQTHSDQTEDNLYIHQSIIVDKGQRPWRIDKFLMDRLAGVSRNRIQQAIKAGSILVDGKEVKPNYKVRPEEVIIVVLPEQPSELTEVKPEKMDLEIPYEDDDLLIVNKPAGLVVHPGTGNWTGTLVNGLAWHLNREEMPVLPGNAPNRPGLVHRIDKETSGLLVIAKTDFCMNRLAKQFYDHTVERKYLALVWGQPDEESGSIDLPIGRNPRDRRLMQTFDKDEEEGKEAITHYRLLEGLYYVSLIECELETGRTHQIRVHMESRGHPVFNDKRYGGDRIRKGTVFSKYKRFVENCFELMPRQALHAATLGFVHPVKGEKMEFVAPLPDDFSAVLDKWRAYVESKRSNLNE